MDFYEKYARGLDFRVIFAKDTTGQNYIDNG